nr:AMP-binding protein [Sediminibacillus albus]
MTNTYAWQPTNTQIEATRLYQWMKKLGFSSYETFHQQTITSVDWFWDQAVKELGLSWFHPYDTTLDLTRGIPYPDWFVGGKINVAYNAVEKWAEKPETRNKVALYWEGDDGTKSSYTYLQLNNLVNAASHGFEQLGIQPGDVIAVYLPMIPETVITMLAASKIGAIFTPSFSGYKAYAVATRLQASGAKLLVTADGYYRRGKKVPMKEEAEKAAAKAKNIQKVVVVERIGNNTVENDREITWETLTKNESDYKCRETFGKDPFMIIYTSGTTGRPKGTVHTHAGFPVKAAFDAGICMDLRQQDTLFWYTDMGWMMGPFLVYGGLINGSSIVMFEGTPDYPEPDRLWKLVDDYQVTHLGLSPTLVRSMMKYGTSPIEKHSISSLRLFASTGEPWNEESWKWLYVQAGNSQIPIFNYSGGTEISGGIFGNILIKPIRPATFNAALPGMDARVFNQEGQPVTDEVGELVLLKPWVGMTNGFYHENDRYEATYWSRWKDTWVHGDWVVQDADGHFTITGRSDDTLNIAGKRIGPTEIESVVASHEAIIEAGVIGVPDQIKGEVAVAFAVLSPEWRNIAELKLEIQQFVTNQLGKALAPGKMFFVNDLPKTRNAKVMRRAIKSAYLNREAGDLSSLENPDTLEEIRLAGNR